jgi:GrpB-like predicted nucleotidyltransferase (UPF0157 family)
LNSRCKKGKVEVIPYDPNWTLLFGIEANKIKTALDDSFAEAHHVGSTFSPEVVIRIGVITFH